jgi:hypothetical protein
MPEPVEPHRATDPEKPPMAAPESPEKLGAGESAGIPTGGPAEPKRWSWVGAATAAAVVLGLALRTSAYLSNHSLWLDESMLALNVLDRSPGQLFDKLDYDQGAPVAFLLAVKLSVAVFGTSESALRLVPFVGSVCGLVGFAALARRVLPAFAAALAVWLFAVSPQVVSYAGECKQYSTDAAIAVGLLLAAVLIPASPGRERERNGRWILLAVAGAASVWASHPAVFVLGGIGLVLLASPAWTGDRTTLFRAGAVIATWGVSFVGVYFISLRQLAGNENLLKYWADGFLPHNPVWVVPWLCARALDFFRLPGGFDAPAVLSVVRLEVGAAGLAVALAVGGTADWVRWARPVAAMLLLTVGITLAASALHKYPVEGRLVLFLVPLACLAVARGGGAVRQALAPSNRVAGWALIVVVAAAPTISGLVAAVHPGHGEEIKPVLTAVRQDFSTDYSLYVYYASTPAFRYYDRELRFPDGRVIYGREHREDLRAYDAELERLKGLCWVVITHPHGDEALAIWRHLDGRGRMIKEVKDRGAVARLYEIT